jgi:hypothetical protein
MPGHEITHKPRGAAGAALSLIVLVGACAMTPIPSDKRVSREQAVTSGKGAYALLTFSDRATIAGELIAATHNSVWILTSEQSVLAVYPVSALESVALGVHDNNARMFGLWTTLGAVSTISHGVLLVFTLPIWLTAGISTTSLESRRGIMEYSPAAFETMNMYARFPQGLPPGIREADLLGAATGHSRSLSPGVSNPSEPPRPRPATVPKYPSLQPDSSPP